ncbi:hypothetical protein Tco_0823375 [Tanacetum coccineum]|uniref:Uncharacterized protein n=1 Tax=Tanacetum coccineum TaxID=301880 RepID=A0ABQ5ALS7_9ASTR
MRDATAQTRVLDLEKTKTTQGNEIDYLKRRVKKVERKYRLRTHKLKSLYKVGLSAWVESSSDEDSLGKDTSKQGRRINAIDVDEDITMVNVQDDAEIFDLLKKCKTPMVKGVEYTRAHLQQQQLTISSKLPSQGNRLQDEFDEEERLAREKAKKEANVVLTEEWDDIQAKIEANQELAQRLQAEEQEELSVEEKAKLFQQLLEQRRKNFDAKSGEEKRNKPPTQAQ